MSDNALLRRSRDFALPAAATILITAIRLFFNHRINFCGTPDSCSYLALGESLSRHQGFVQNFLYQYQFLSPTLPSHGIEYWRPGTSFFLLLAQPFGGVTLHSSQAVATLMTIALSLCAWRIAFDWTHDRPLANASYLLCLVMPPAWFASSSPDSGLFYGTFAALFLLSFTVQFRSYGRDALAFVGLAGVNLIRNDAILFAVPLAVVLFLRLRSARGNPNARGASPAYALLILAAFALALLPMNLIDLLVLGKAFPPGTGGAIYLNDLSDLMKYHTPLNLHTLLATGIGHLVTARLVALPTIVYRILFLVVGFGIVFLPALFMRHPRLGVEQPAATETRRVPEIAGSLAFFATIVLVYGAALPAIGTFSALRSFVGLIPIIAVLIVAAIRSIAVTPAAASCLVTSLVALYLTSGVMLDRRTVEESAKSEDLVRRVALQLSASGATPAASLIMTADPAAFYVQTGFRTIPIPNDDLSMMAAATQDLHATHILINRDEVHIPQPALQAALHPSSMTEVPSTPILILSMR